MPAAGPPQGPPRRTVERPLGVPAGLRRLPPRVRLLHDPVDPRPLRSRPLDDIVAEARSSSARGAREIVLIGQDISPYGRDLGDGRTPSPTSSAPSRRVPGVDWLRLMYVQPDGVTDELLEAMADDPNVCRYLDIPLQHAVARVLRAMERRGSAEDFLRLLERIRAVMPDVVLRTTLIAGFPARPAPTCTSSSSFLEAARFDYVGVFAYSPEEGTRAAEMPDQVPPRTRRARAQRLRDVADRIGFEKAAERVGQTLEVLVEGVDEDEGVVVGRWRGQAPEIDGVVLLDDGAPRGRSSRRGSSMRSDTTWRGRCMA